MIKHERHYYIDALRVIAILLMFLYHTSMIFVAEWGWHIKNTEQSRVLLEVNYWISLFRMPLLFFVSGFVSYALLSHIHWSKFIGLRFQRLIIPTVIWTFILIAPQIYFERKSQGSNLSYLEFYKTFLQFNWWPNGNFHWLHLWFIPYLFVYNLISIPIIVLLDWYKDFTNKLKASNQTHFILAVFVLIAAIPYALLTVRFPVTYDLIHDYARHAFYLFFILAGLLFFKFDNLVKLVEDKRKEIFRLAFLTMLVIYTLRWNDWDPFHIWSNWIEKPQTYLWLILLNINSWLWVLTFIGYGKRYLNKPSAFLHYCNEAIYPFYILHQSIIVIIGYYVVQTSDNVIFKFVFILIVCFSLCLAIYHLLIKPYKMVRFLFGIK